MCAKRKQAPLAATCYTIPMGLCYVGGFQALTLALVGCLPGDYLPPRGPGGINQHGELAVVEGAQRPEQLTTDRDRFSFKCVGASLRQQSRCAGANGAEGVRKSVADLL